MFQSCNFQVSQVALGIPDNSQVTQPLCPQLTTFFDYYTCACQFLGSFSVLKYLIILHTLQVQIKGLRTSL